MQVLSSADKQAVIPVIAFGAMLAKYKIFLLNLKGGSEIHSFYVRNGG